MHRLALAYAKFPGWRSRRDEAQTLLERAAAAGDIYAKRDLASSMAWGWYGVRYIPEGFRLMISGTNEMVELIKNEDLVTPDKSARLEISGYFSRLCPFVANRIPA